MRCRRTWRDLSESGQFHNVDPVHRRAREGELVWLGNLGMTEMLLIVASVMLLLGAKKIPDLAKGIREFRKEMRGIGLMHADDE